MCVLSYTFTGGPHYLHERMQDTWHTCNIIERRDLLNTFTCSPKWADISNNLIDDQKTFHRHDHVARVFHLKVKKPLILITKGAYFYAICLCLNGRNVAFPLFTFYCS